MVWDAIRIARKPEKSCEHLRSRSAHGNVTNVTMKGVGYELEGEDLQTGTRGVGNKANSSPVTINHEGGDLLFIWEANVP